MNPAMHCQHRPNRMPATDPGHERHPPGRVMTTRRTLRYLLMALMLIHGVAVDAARKPVKTARPGPESTPANAAPPVSTITLAYLAEPSIYSRTRPFFDPAAQDEGLQGARLGIADNNTTGQFTRQAFVIEEHITPTGENPATALRALVASGHHFILADLPASRLKELANLPEAARILLFDVARQEDSLRGADCRNNVLHLLPSHAMKADALAQYLSRKRWNRWFLIVGKSGEDLLTAEALRKSAKKFGAKIVEDKTWEHTFGDRGTPESTIPTFTQGADHDVVVVVDDEQSFGDLVPYRTWSPRPVVGASGLKSLAWHYTLEAWGALQLQNRFRQQAGRWMSEKDYAAWLAVRAIGEAATRTHATDFATIAGYLRGEQFSLAGFKGTPLSFRSWDLQLRQPILLTTERSVVAVAPIEGYLHPSNELDTLGTDAAESTCRFQ